MYNKKKSEFEKSILYSTYDVTDLLKSGKNTIIAQVAGGIYNIEYLNGRYSKGEVKNNGETALISELMIEYEDGTKESVASNESWIACLGSCKRHSRQRRSRQSTSICKGTFLW